MTGVLDPGGVLSQILATKVEEVAAARAIRSFADLDRAARLVAPPRSLGAALTRRPEAEIRILAEIKRASPSAGAIRPNADPVTIAQEYADGGAAAISVLTDRRYFDGDLSFLSAVRTAVAIPLLRKDFLIDAYQVVEARAASADAVLLIVAALDDALLRELLAAAAAYGMDALVEVHDEAEAERALRAGARVVGVNHRDLRTFQIDMGLTGRLAARVPTDVVLVGESGIKTPEDLRMLTAAGAHAALVGETLMRAASPGQALRQLRGQLAPS